jgi:hypothetical protein
MLRQQNKERVFKNAKEKMPDLFTKVNPLELHQTSQQKLRE